MSLSSTSSFGCASDCSYSCECSPWSFTWYCTSCCASFSSSRLSPHEPCPPFLISCFLLFNNLLQYLSLHTKIILNNLLYTYSSCLNACLVDEAGQGSPFPKDGNFLFDGGYSPFTGSIYPPAHSDGLPSVHEFFSSLVLSCVSPLYHWWAHRSAALQICCLSFIIIINLQILCLAEFFIKIW